MIRRGRAEGWLTLPPSALLSWAALNGCELNSVKVDDLAGRGCGVVAEQDLPTDNGTNTLMSVPRDLVLSLESVKVYAQADKTLSDILECLGDFGNTTRGAILSFLLCQASLSCPDVTAGGPLRSPFTEYIKFLPLNDLPTSWAGIPELSEALGGTTLGPALSAKLNSLQREFDELKRATKSVAWCSKNWWGKPTGTNSAENSAESEMANIISRLGREDGDSPEPDASEGSNQQALITFDDWLQVDHFYRSRALEFPGIGDATVPVIDMANHASGNATTALYECDANGNAVLLLRDGKSFKSGHEVTITYGDLKGACEMLFSYGFIEHGVEDARELFLDVEIPGDDPLARAKKHVAKSAPGFKIFRTDGGEIDWEGEFIWWVVVNEEDGLDFQVMQSNDGGTELIAFWKDGVLTDESDLLRHLKSDTAMWDVFQLRAIATLQGRTQSQRETLAQSEGAVETLALPDQDHNLALDKIRTLRRLEQKLLEAADAMFEERKQDLLQSPQVQEYLSSAAVHQSLEEEDFS